VTAPSLIFGDIVDNDRLEALPDFMANRGVDLQFAAGRQTEVDLVQYATGNPTVLGDSGHGGESHAGYAAYNIKDCGDRLYAADAVHIGLEV